LFDGATKYRIERGNAERILPVVGGNGATRTERIMKRLFLTIAALCLGAASHAQDAPADALAKRASDALARSLRASYLPAEVARMDAERDAAKKEFEAAMADLANACEPATATRLRTSFSTFEEWLTVAAVDREARARTYASADLTYVSQVDSTAGAQAPIRVRTVPKDLLTESFRPVWEYAIARPAAPGQEKAGVHAAWRALGEIGSPATARFLKAYAGFLSRADVPYQEFLNLGVSLRGTVGMHPSPEAADALLTIYAASFQKERVGEKIGNRPPSPGSEPLIEVRNHVASLLAGRQMGTEHTRQWQALAQRWPRAGLTSALTDLLAAASQGKMPDAALRPSLRGKGLGLPASPTKE
jgi:hypothetical protein